MEVLPNEKKGTTASFLQRALLHFQAQGVQVRKLLTDNGSAYRSKAFKAMREAYGLKHSRTRPYRPRTNGKAERLIQTALREWAYGPAWQSSDERNQALNAWLHYYNHHRPHSALGGHVPLPEEGLNFTGEDSPMSVMMLTMMGAVAEFERAMILERQREGIAKAKSRGAYKGRPYFV